MKKIILITGQTAAGKTSLALRLAKENNGELINCDSRQIYKYLDIISGKDLTDKVWLYDIVYPNQYFSSFDYVQCAFPIVKKLLDENKTPIIVGGTYLYFYHLLYSVASENIPPDWKLRKELEEKSVEKLQQKLKEINPQLFERLNNSDKNNPRRLMRKIEILLSGKNDYQGLQFGKITLAEKLGIKNIKIEFIGLKFSSKEKAAKAIEKRVEKRLQKGAIEEVKNLLDKGYDENDPGMKTIGYQQFLQYFKNKISKEEAIKEWIQRELQYAKRQYTFMKRDSNIRWTEV